MSYKHGYKSKMYVLARDLVDSEVMEQVEGKVVAMIDPIVFDPEVMGLVGSYKPGKPLMKVVLPSELVDDESIEVVEDLIPVWCDPEVEFNPATMDFVTWEKKESSRSIHGINIHIPDVSKIIENMPTFKNYGNESGGFHRISKNRTVNDLYVGCLVEEGIELVVKGDNYGSLKMLKNSKVRIDGDSYGPIENDGGILDVCGDVYASIKTTNGGTTNIGEESDIYASVD